MLTKKSKGQRSLHVVILWGARTAVLLSCLLVLAGPVFSQRAQELSSRPCRLTYTVVKGDTLREVADRYFADKRYDSAILFATNARDGIAPFKFVLNPGDLAEKSGLCIPGPEEAEWLRSRYETYLRAVREMPLPVCGEGNKALIEIEPNRPLRVVTWIRANEAGKYKIGGVQKAPKDLWVTVVPKVKEFCQGFERTHGPGLMPLTLRLEERLGLLPVSNKADFVEIVINKPARTRAIFRPCSDPSTSKVNCTIGPPAETGKRYRQWFLVQYYSSHADAYYQVPWTALGYTFDWATESKGGEQSDFVRIGESEFVIPGGAPIEVKSITPTADYCTPQ